MAYKTGDFQRKYGHNAAEHTAIMAQRTAVLERENAATDESRIRPGKLDTKGQVYPA